MLNNPGTDELMVTALKTGGKVVGAAPYTDSSPHGQIDRIFEMARGLSKVPIRPWALSMTVWISDAASGSARK